MTVAGLRTPCLVVYKDVAEANAAVMLRRAARLGCVLRPHMKTHKTLEAGAIATGGTKRCIAVSTMAEAGFYADGGFDDILYAVPITPDKVPAAAELTRRLEAFHVMVDHKDQVAALEAATDAPVCPAIEIFPGQLTDDFHLTSVGTGPCRLVNVK
eukprot:gene2766-3393_t